MELNVLIAPFAEFAFLRRALVACIALSICGGAVGTLLLLRRMALVGDAMAHAILPGAAIGFLSAGLSIWSMAIGGLVAAAAVALLAGWISRRTAQREDASFAAIYLIALAAGVLIVSQSEQRVDVLHLLFGAVLAVDDAGLLLVASACTLVLLALGLMFRAIVVDSFDRHSLPGHGVNGAMVHFTFVAMLVLQLVAGFQVLGTLMSVGLLVLPAAAARFWTSHLDSMIAVAIAFGALSSLLGLLLSYHANLPSGPAIVLLAGAAYAASALVGPHGGILSRMPARRHRTG
jgi:zinc/manganese transport system permease protein